MVTNTNSLLSMKQKGHVLVILVIFAALTIGVVIYSQIRLNKYSSSLPNIHDQPSKLVQEASSSTDKQQSSPNKIEAERYKVEVPADSTDRPLTLHMKAYPNEKISEEIRSVFYTIMINAYDQSGNQVNELKKPFSIIVDSTGWDLSPYKQGTLAIYYNNGGAKWIKLDTKIDHQKNTATAQLSKFGQFGLMAERTDTLPPKTTPSLKGKQKEFNLFNSDVIVTLLPQDNIGGLGINYTLYKIDSEEWKEYKNPFIVSKEGSHSVEFFSVDNDENMEQGKSIFFTISNNIN